MTTTNFTTSLGLALPTTGDLSGTWGDTVNDYISKYLDTAVAGALTVSTDVTLLKTTNAALGATSSQYAILIASGHAANITVTAPAVSKVYLVINKSGSYTVKICGAGPTTGITVPVSTAALVAWDGSDFALFSSTDVNSLNGVLTAAKGGTGITSLGAGISTWLGTPSSANLAAAVTDETGSGALVFANSPTLGAFSATGNVNLDGGTFTFNDSAADRDARFEGLTEQNLLFLDASTNRIGIGTNIPSRRIELSGASLNDSGLAIKNTSTSTSIANYPGIVFSRNQTITNNLQILGRLSWEHTLTDLSTKEESAITVAGSNVFGSDKAKMSFMATGGFAFVAESTGTFFGSTPGDTDVVLVIDTNNVGVTYNAKLGYYSSSGGTVTQATSRITGVTLNKTNGAITLVSAAGTTSWQSFTVTNSLVAATDVVYVCQKSGSDLYEIHVTNVAAGSFQISFRTTGGTTTEQPVFNFVVLGAVTS